MRKMLLTTLTVCMVALLSMLWMPAVAATTPTPVSGGWTWIPEVIDMWEADGNIFITAYEYDTVTGDFVGSGVGVFGVVFHPNGAATGNGETVFEGEVLGYSGTVVFKWAGHIKAGETDWSWYWQLLSGTGELANLRGQGTGWGTPTTGQYSGKIFFAP